MKKIPMTSWLQNFFGGSKRSPKKRRMVTASKIVPQHMELLESRIVLATHVWTGAVDALWSTAGNWDVGAPDSADDVVQFNGGFTTTQDIVGLTIGQIHFTAGGNTILGTTPLTVDGDGQVQNLINDAGDNTLDATLSLSLLNNDFWAQVLGGSVTVASNISGAEGLTLTDGPGTLVLTGTNIYTGDTTVEDGVLQLNSPALDSAIGTGDLFIGDGIGAAGTARVELLQGGEIDNGATVTVRSDGVFDLGIGVGFETITNLTINEGGSVTGTRPVDVAAALTFNGAASSTLAINAINDTAGGAAFNGAAAFNFTSATSLVYNGGLGSTLTINNPVEGVYGPTGGITFNSVGGGGTLFNLGGGDPTADVGVYTPINANDGTITHSDGVVTQTINFTGLSPITDTVDSLNFTINGTAGVDVINIVDGPVAGQLQVNSASFELINFSNKINVTVNGLGGSDTINVNVTAAVTGLATLTIDGGTEGDTVNVLGTTAVPVTVNGGAGDDTITVGNAGSLDGITGVLNLDGGADNNRLFIDDSADASGNTYVVTGTSITRNGGAAINFSGFQGMNLAAGGGDDTTTITNLSLNGNGLGGGVLNLSGAGGGADSLTLDNVDLTGGGGDGLAVSGYETVAIQNGSSFSGNAGDGAGIFGATTSLTISTTDASSNGGDGLQILTAGTVAISSTTAITNTGDGIEMTAVGAVTLTSVVANGNDPGVLVNGAASFSDTDGVYVLNNDHGIQLIDIAGDVTLTRTLAVDNDNDDNGTGDGVFATDGGDGDALAIGGSLTVNGGTFVDSDGFGANAVSQVNGINAGAVGVNVTFDGSVDAITATGHENRGVQIGAVTGDATFTSGAYVTNGDDGVNIASVGGNLVVTDVTGTSNVGDGFQVSAVTGTATISNVGGGGFNANGGDGFDLNAVGGLTTFTSVGANANGFSGLELSNLADLTITDGSFSGNSFIGVDVATAGNVLFTNVNANGNGADGAELNGVGNVTLDGGSFSGNAVDGIFVATGDSISFTNVNANGNGDDGADLATVDDVTIDGGSYSGNVTDGINITTTDTVSLTNVNANGNDSDTSGDGAGLDASGTGAVTITGGSFSGNGLDHGIDLDTVGAVVISGIIANGNDPGVNINVAPSVAISSSTVSGNNDGGIYVSNITGSVTLTDVTAEENDADEDNIGDGFNATVVGGPIVILGGSYSDPDVDADDQENGIAITASPTARVFIGNDGATVNPVTASGNVDDGIDIDSVTSASLDTVTANSNGNFGFELSSMGNAILTDLTLAGNATDGGSLNGIGVADYTTNKAANGSVDDTLILTPTTLTRTVPAQQTIQYAAVSVLEVFTGLGADTIDVQGTGATGLTQVFGGSGNDTITVAGSNLLAANNIYGDLAEDLVVTDTVGGVVATPVPLAGNGNDEITLNVATDITATSLFIDGNGNAPLGVADSANRDRVTINNAGAVTALGFDWSQNGNFGLDVTGFAIPVVIFSTETVQYNDTVGNDTVATLVGQATDDEITVVPVSANSAAAFIGGDPFEDTTELPFAGNLPGFAGGGLEADLSFTGLITAGGIFVDGNGSGGPVGDQLFVYGQTEAGIIDPVASGAGYTIFNNLATYGAGELVDAVGFGNAFDIIGLTDTLVTVNGFVTVGLDPNDFVQVDPTLTSGLIINSGDELLPLVPDPNCDGFRADQINVSLSTVIPMTVNGGDPPNNGVNHQGDEINYLGTFLEVQVWSDKSVPPTVSFEFIPFVGFFQPLRESSIECHGPINTLTLTLLGDNNDPLAPDQTDNFVVVGEDVDVTLPGGDADGANELSLVINGSIDIPFRGVVFLNAFGDDETAAGDTAADTLEVTPYADYSNGGNPPSSPLGWGIDTFFNEGSDDGDQNDLLIVNGVVGVSEVTTLTPSDEDDGQVRVAHVDGTLIANITYVANIGFIFNGNDGSGGDTDRLVLLGTDGVTSPGTSGDETVAINYDNTGVAASPFITVGDTSGAGLYSIHNITNYDRITLDLSAGNDTVTITDGAAVGGAGFASTIVDLTVGDGNDVIDASASTTARSYTFDGGAGNDTITGGAGNDIIYGGLGDDTLNGGDGNDLLDGGDGIDNLTGGVGADAIYGGIGNDVLDGGVDDDLLDGGDGVDTLTGGAGADDLYGGDGGDEFLLNSTSGDDYVDGGAGADFVTYTTDGAAVTVGQVPGGTNGFTITAAGATPDVYDVEELDIDGTAAADAITLDDVSGSGLQVISIDLGAGSADTVSVDGRSTADNLAIANGAAAQVVVQGLGYELYVNDATTADGLTVNGGDGNDTIKANAGVEGTIGITLNGDDGDDDLSADAVINGGAGNDTLTGGAGADTINGNAGDDTIIFSAGAGVDTIDGGTGFDTFLVNTNGDNNTISVSEGAVTVDGNTETLAVSNLEQFLVNSGDGNDAVTVTLATVQGVINTGAGNDTVTGTASAAALTISGGTGDDTLLGGAGADLIYGGSGNDILIGGAGVDQEYGEDGNDRFGDLSLTGNGAADDAGADFLFGGDGIDNFIWEPGDGSDVIQGGVDAADILRFIGTAAAETFNLSANAGAPTHFNLNLGGATVDTHGVEQVILTAGTGADAVNVGDLSTTEIASVVVDLGAGDADAVTVNGRNTADNLSVSSAAAGSVAVQGLGYDVSLSNAATTDTLTVNGNDGNDTIKANAGVEATVTIVFNGNDGDDNLSADATLNGGNGNDTLEGGAGADTINGDAGDDTIIFNAGAGVDTIDGGTGFDTFVVTANGANNVISVAEGAVTVDGNTETLALSNVELFHVNSAGGNDTITVSLATVAGLIEAGSGDDTVNGSASAAALTIQGGDGNDTLTGGSAADLIFGGSGNDLIIGGAGVDAEYGEDGNDQFGDASVAGNGAADDAGADLVFGGAGADTFIWEPGDGSDVVQGGDDEGDVLRFLGSAAANAFLLSASADNTTHFNLNLGAATVDTAGVEQVVLSAQGGADSVTVNDLSTTEIEAVTIDLGAGDADTVTVNGRNTADDLAVSSAAAGSVSVEGFGYDLDLLNAATADTLTVNGNEGNDSIKANTGVETTVTIVFNGNDGNDFLSADATLNGGNGDDVLVGGVGDDILNGDAGDDIITGGTGVDAINGGTGTDTVLETRDANFTITDGTLIIGAEGTDTLASIEQADLRGGASANTFNIGLFTGKTTLFGASGSDTVSFSTATAAINFDLDATDVDQVINLAGRTIVLSDIMENVVATAFNDTIRIDIAAFNRFVDGGLETSIPPGDRLFVDMLGSNPSTTKVPNGKLGSFDGTVNGSGFLGTISYVDIETLAILNPNGGGGNNGGIPIDFGAATNYPIANGPHGVVAADVNGDGILDMIVSGKLSGTVSVRFGNGFGGFGTEAVYNSGSVKKERSITVALGDVDNDGDLDVVVTNRMDNSVGVLLNDGAGVFTDATTFSTGVGKFGKFPMSVKLGDMNNDGDLDIVTTNASKGKKHGSIAILLGNGAGGFGAANTTITQGRKPRDLELGDFDGDGNLDVVATDLFSRDIVYMAGNGAGGLAAPVSYAVGRQPTSIVAADFNGDGVSDLAITCQVTKELSVLLGNPDGTFQETLGIKYPGVKLEISINSADLNGDGNADLIIANRITNTLSYMLGLGNGTFDTRVDFKVGGIHGREPVAIAYGDFNNDGAIDLMVANAGTDDVSVLLRNPII